MSLRLLSWDVPKAFGVGVVLQMYQLALGILTFRVSIYFWKAVAFCNGRLTDEEYSTNLWV